MAKATTTAREGQAATAAAEAGSAETALEKQGTQAVAAFDFGEDASAQGKGAAGYENQTPEDSAIPMLYVLQSNSPIVEKGEVPDARPGVMMNNITQQLLDGKTGVMIVPAYTRHEFVEFKPRKEGGGFQGRHAIDSPTVLSAKARAQEQKLEFGDYFTESGNELTETFAVFACIVDEKDVLGMVMIPFSGTKIKVYKQWMTRNRTCLVPTPAGGKVNPPLFANLAKLGTAREENSKGAYYNFRVEAAVGNDMTRSLLTTADPRYQAAKALKMLAESGEAKVNYDAGKEERVASQKAGEAKTPF